MALAPPATIPGFDLPEPLWREVVEAWRSPGRFYHDVRHLEEVLGGYERVAADVGWRQPREVLLALLFHDAVYVPGRSDNEEESAAFARRSIEAWLGSSGVDVARVEQLIRLTARHGALAREEVDPEAALFLDVDMSILGESSARFAEYERDVALEYAAVPPELYAAGRRRFLEGLLAAERIFLSDYFHARLETKARENVAP